MIQTTRVKTNPTTLPWQHLISKRILYENKSSASDASRTSLQRSRTAQSLRLRHNIPMHRIDTLPIVQTPKTRAPSPRHPAIRGSLWRQAVQQLQMSDCEKTPRTSCSAHPTASESSSLMQTLRSSSPEGRKGVTAPALATTGIGDARRHLSDDHCERATRRATVKAWGGFIATTKPVHPSRPSPRSTTAFSDTLPDRPGRAAGPSPPHKSG